MSARRALIVANDAYERDGLRDLVAPGADAEALGRVLADPLIGGFAVSVLRNESAHVIQAQVEEFFADNQRDDVLLLHFSCHGLKSQSGALYLAATNTRPERLASTAIPASFVNGCMQASRARSVVLLLDCCYGGAFARGLQARAGTEVSLLDSFPQEPPSDDRGRAVITASGATEFAFEGDALAENHGRPSVFTAAVVEGLATGDADRNEDGWVGLDELYDYVYARVREHSPYQRPGRIMELSGELYLARSRRRWIRPEPIHADLQAAITSDNMYARLGAVDELRARLGSADLPAAAGAHAALAEVARGDIQYVADRARAALGDVAIRPDPAALEFGEVRHGDPAPHRPVRLGGPPLARTVTVRPSADWISVSQDEDALDVSVATGGAGTLRGSLTITGTPGQVVVPVTATIVAPVASPPVIPEPPPVAPEPAPVAPEPASAIPEPAAVIAEPASVIPEPAAVIAEPASAIPEPAAVIADLSAPQAGWAGSGGVMSAPPAARRRTGPRLAGQSPARPAPARGLAVATGLALTVVAALTGMFSIAASDGPAGTPAYLQVIEQTELALPLLVALAAALPRFRRLGVLGFLQGSMWPRTGVLANYLAGTLFDHMFRNPGEFFASYVYGIVSTALALLAAVILLLAWRPAAARRRSPQAGPRTVLIMVTIALAVAAYTVGTVLAGTSAPNYALAVVESATGLAVGWYALSLRSRGLGAALLLGWTVQAALVATADVTSYSVLTVAGRVSGVAACVMVGLLVIQVIAYRRAPGPHPGQPGSPVAPTRPAADPAV